jgi:hypothetical protein
MVKDLKWYNIKNAFKKLLNKVSNMLYFLD